MCNLGIIEFYDHPGNDGQKIKKLKDLVCNIEISQKLFFTIFKKKLAINLDHAYQISNFNQRDLNENSGKYFKI